MAKKTQRGKPASDDAEPAAMGRPKVKIDEVNLGALAQLQCTLEEAAAFFHCTERTIITKLKDPVLREIWDRGQALGRVSLRRLQWRHAKGTGSSAVQMTIHLSKHHLGQTEKAALELTGRVDSTVEVNSARDRVTRKLDALSERITRRVDGIAVAEGAGHVSRQPV